MDAEVTSVTVLDRHSGTTGRAHVALTGHPSVPPSAFVKLAPFDAEQRKFVNLQGMGVAEARFYRDLAPEVPVRVPKVWYAEFEGTGSGDDDRYVMVLEDLVASGCRFPTREDADIEARIFDIVEQLARLHAQYWQSPRFGATRRPRRGSHRAGPARRRRRATSCSMAIDNLADRLPEGFVEARRDVHRARAGDPASCTARASARSCTAIRTSATSSSTATTRRRTGFLDWAVISHAPGIRDVAYVLSASTPTELRARARAGAARALPRGSRRARRHPRRRPRVGAVPPVHDLRMVRGYVHGGDGFEVAAGTHRSRRHRTGDDRRDRPRLRRPDRTPD